jgi:hypothetical protein
VPELGDFAAEQSQEIVDLAEREGLLRPEAFTLTMIRELNDAGELDGGQVAYHRAHGLEISGYAASDDGTTLDLIASLYTGSVPPRTVSKQEIDTAVSRATRFLQRARADLITQVEESTAAFDMVDTVRQLNALRKVRVLVVTDGLTRERTSRALELDGIDIQFHIWDIERLYRCVTSGQRQESIDIDFVLEFGNALPCLSEGDASGEYTAYLAVIPGTVLSRIYERYGTRLLERNVRAFLQTRGKVNSGIRQTLLNQPERFLAYNNGISATASDVRLTRLPSGAQGISGLSDLQIVNGGQTTASIHHVAVRDKADLSGVGVQAKITLVPPDRLSEIVPLISRYANSQNKVNEADFEANSPFHIEVERWSRTVWAPAVGTSAEQTRWFYERARGQYQDAMAKEGTPARIRRFRVLHPTTQKFTKTDLAKFENSWDQLPNIVSLGAEKNFQRFTDRIRTRGRYPVTQEYFERLVAKAILFRGTERVVSGLGFAGYRANTVTYSIAYLSEQTNQQLDLDRIWTDQDITDETAEALASIAGRVRNVLLDAPGSGNVTEWSKKPACWERVRALEIPLPADLGKELVDADWDPWRSADLVLSTLESVAPRAVGKAEILRSSGLDEAAWTPTIRSLLEQGRVIRQGQRRGATYQLPES